MAEKASTSAAKDVINSKTVLELLEEDDEFEVSQSSNLGSLKTIDHLHNDNLCLWQHVLLQITVTSRQ